MKKLIRKHGTSVVIVLDAEDQKLYNMKVGDTIDLIHFEVFDFKGKRKYSEKKKRMRYE